MGVRGQGGMKIVLFSVFKKSYSMQRHHFCPPKEKICPPEKFLRMSMITTIKKILNVQHHTDLRI